MKRNTFIILLISLLVLCAIPFIEQEDSFPQTASKLLEVKTKADKAEVMFESRMIVLQKQSDSLTLKFSKHQQQLNKAKVKSTQAQKKVLESIAELESTVDTASALERCDSLKNKAIALIQEIQQRDSLCDESMIDLASLLGKKDSIIYLLKLHQEDLKSSLNSSIEEGKQLEQQLASKEKSIKRKTLLNKCLSAGMLILTGISATLFIIQK